MKHQSKLKTILALLLCAVLLVGCGGGNASSSGSSGNDKDTTLRIAYPSTITTLDVTDGDGATMLKEVAGVIETLVAVDSDFNLHPSLATKWERVEDKKWKFDLRDDVKFHDGTQFNAAAVKWCIERSLKENTSLSKTTGIQSVDVIDDYTIQVNTSIVTGDLPQAFCNVTTAIVAPSSVDSSGEFVKAVGTGYFQQESFDVSSGTFTCVPFENYRDKVTSNVTKRVILSMADSSTRSLAVQNGDVDIASDVPFSDYQTLSNSKDVKVEKFNTARTYFYSYNLNREPLKDPNVRKALIHAIDKKDVMENILLGVGDVPKGIFVDNMPWANTNVPTYEYDVNKAKQLLEQSGYRDSDGDGFLDKDGKKLSIRIIAGTRRPGNPLIVQATQGYFANIGIDTKVDMLDGNALNEVVKSGDYDLNLSSAATGYIPSAAYYLAQNYHSDSTNAKNIGYSNTRLDALVDQCKAETDLSKKNELSKQAQIIAQDDVAIYTVELYGAVFVLSNRVKNFSYSAAVHDFIVPYDVSID